MKCKICDSNSAFIFKAFVLNKYHVSYYKCSSCGFIQTENPFWLSEAYASAITALDIGLVRRNLSMATTASRIIKNNFNHLGQFLDYAGGYGLFVRLMRDNGFQFYRQDIFCENIFAKNFDIDDLNDNSRFELVTAFELFEHLTHPEQEIKKIFHYTDSLLFSTELCKIELKGEYDWWYISPETGQHIAFYTEKSLEIIAQKLELNFFTNGSSLHMFSTKQLDKKILHRAKENFLVRAVNKIAKAVNKKFDTEITMPTLIHEDVKLIKEKLLTGFRSEYPND